MSTYHYDPETGVFTNTKTGRQVGKSKSGSYVKLMIDGKSVGAHRYAWFLVHGVWPTYMIDHINGDPADNRIANLREATNTENQWNQKAKHEHKGWFRHARTLLYTVQIRHKGQRHTVGYFKDPESAEAAYRAARLQLRGREWNE